MNNYDFQLITNQSDHAFPNKQTDSDYFCSLGYNDHQIKQPFQLNYIKG